MSATIPSLTGTTLFSLLKFWYPTLNPYGSLHLRYRTTLFCPHSWALGLNCSECMLSHFSRVRLLWPHGLWPTRLLCPWCSPGKNTGMDCPPPGDLPDPGNGNSRGHWLSHGAKSPVSRSCRYSYTVFLTYLVFIDTQSIHVEMSEGLWAWMEKV